MQNVRAAHILILLLVANLLSGCTGTSSHNSNHSAVAGSNQNAVGANAAQTNVEELGVFVKMPYETEEAVWRQDASQKKLVAVLRFSAADADKLAAQAAKFRKPSAVTVTTESWFPPELIAQSDVSGDDTLKGTSYAANDFLQPPYSEGQLTRIEASPYFVLEVMAK